MTETKRPSRLRQAWWKVRSLWPSVYRTMSGFGYTKGMVTHYSVMWLGRERFEIVSRAEWDKIGRGTAQAYIRGHAAGVAGDPISYYTQRRAEADA